MMIKPYYEEKGITIYCGDCRDILPQIDSVDLVLTDPPYGINGGRGGTSKKRGKGNYEGVFTADDDTPNFIKTVVVPTIKKLIKKSKAVIVTTGNSNICLYPQPNSFGVIYEPATSGMQRWGWCDGHPIFYYGISPVQGKEVEPCSFKNTKKDDCNFNHPCVKPLSLWKKLLLKGSKEFDTVLDPFVGAGTTLRAAKDLNRKAIGIEINEKYCEIAVKRLQQEVFDFS